MAQRQTDPLHCCSLSEHTTASMVFARVILVAGQKSPQLTAKKVDAANSQLTMPLSSSLLLESCGLSSLATEKTLCIMVGSGDLLFGVHCEGRRVVCRLLNVEQCDGTLKRTCVAVTEKSRRSSVQNLRTQQ